MSPVPFFTYFFSPKPIHFSPFRYIYFKKKIKNICKWKPESYALKSRVTLNICVKENKTMLLPWYYSLCKALNLRLTLSLPLNRLSSVNDDLLRLSPWLNQDGKIIEKGISFWPQESLWCPCIIYISLILPCQETGFQKLVWWNLEDCVFFPCSVKWSPLFFKIYMPWGRKPYGFDHWQSPGHSVWELP